MNRPIDQAAYDRALAQVSFERQTASSTHCADVGPSSPRSPRKAAYEADLAALQAQLEAAAPLPSRMKVASLAGLADSIAEANAYRLRGED